MKVRQLINILQEEDPNAEVKLLKSETDNCTYPIERVYMDENDTVFVLVPDDNIED